jgi:Raf kinase inhibitor-like YbhB/YbcL family protein
MRLTSESFEDGAPIPSEFAFAKHHPETHVEMCPNKNPQLAWSDAPEGTKSFVLVCHDTDVPSAGDDVNQEGKRVPADLPRVDFYHWLLLDIPAEKTSIAAGELADGVVARGKPGPDAAGGMRQGVNDYTAWFAGDADMEGTYHGYDGPCPPWNDTIIHHYHFTLYALDTDRTPIDGAPKGAELLAALEGHVLDKASIVGTYTINPDAK